MAARSEKTALETVKNLDLKRYMGRWYEVNKHKKGLNLILIKLAKLSLYGSVGCRVILHSRTNDA